MMQPESPGRSRHFFPLLAGVLLAVLIVPTLAADDPDGIYKVTRAYGITYVEHKFDFPPQEILAAAVGHKTIVKDGRIQRNDRARGEISRMIVQDPRLLDQVFSFHIWQLPRFGRFKASEDGVFRADTVSPFIIEISLKYGGELSAVTAWAYYHAELTGNKLVMKVRFYGRGGYYRGDGESYDTKGHAKIVSHRKPAQKPQTTSLEFDDASALNGGFPWIRAMGYQTDCWGAGDLAIRSRLCRVSQRACSNHPDSLSLRALISARYVASEGSVAQVSASSAALRSPAVMRS